MIIEYGHHCFGDILRVDGIDFEDMTKEGQLEIILLAAADKEVRREMFQTALYSFEGEEIESNHYSCDSCGDWNSYTKIEIK